MHILPRVLHDAIVTSCSVERTCRADGIETRLRPGHASLGQQFREDLCYEWLYFKGRQSAANLRDFARGLIARESAGFADPRSVCDIRRRVAAVLRAYRIKTSRKPCARFATPAQGNDGQRPPRSVAITRAARSPERWNCSAQMP